MALSHLKRPAISQTVFKCSNFFRCFASSGDAGASSFKPLACPLCFEPLSKGTSCVNSGFSCSSCLRDYHENSNGVIDLTIPSTSPDRLASSIFQNTYVAQLYDRYYRESFRLWGFPGFQKEFDMAHQILQPCHGKTMMDLSCAGGSSTRKFLSSNAYELVIASDYSEAMLNQCSLSLKNDPEVSTRSKLLLVKADAQRLPFTASSLAAVHSSAAMHCWPHPFHAVSEIARLLEPGGIFVASTFLFPQPASLLNRLVQPLRQALERIECPLRLWTEAELREIVESNGLVEWKSTKRGGAFILFSASKPV